MRKQGRKPIVCYFDKKPLKLSYENKEENLIIIEDKNKTSGGSRLKV